MQALIRSEVKRVIVYAGGHVTLSAGHVTLSAGHVSLSAGGRVAPPHPITALSACQGVLNDFYDF
jgi:hypothetical protein